MNLAYKHIRRESLNCLIGWLVRALHLVTLRDRRDQRRAAINSDATLRRAIERAPMHPCAAPSNGTLATGTGARLCSSKAISSNYPAKRLVQMIAGSVMCVLINQQVAAQAFELDQNSTLADTLSSVPENTWLRLNINEFQDVWPPENQRPGVPTAPSRGSPQRVISAWGSMAWDSNRGNLIFWGGGHANYPGNEVYLWSATTGLWSRASLPSEMVEIRSSLFEPIDGLENAPPSAHTYDNSEFLPVVDRWITIGGAAFNTGRWFETEAGRRTGPYVWDPSKANPNAVGGTAGSQVSPTQFPGVIGGEMWQNRDNLAAEGGVDDPRPVGFTGLVNMASAYHKEAGVDVLYLNLGSVLAKLTVVDPSDPSTDVYSYMGRYITEPFSGQGAGGYDPSRNLFLRTAASNAVFTYWQLDNPGRSNRNEIFTPQVIAGNFDFSTLGSYGLDYDGRRGSFLMWSGLQQVWQLMPPEDIDDGDWTLAPLDPLADTVAPNHFPSTGVLGKWKYIDALDVFLGVTNGNTGDIWAYKPNAWQPRNNDGNLVPNISITAPANRAQLSSSTIPISANASDDGMVTNVQFFVDGKLIGEDDEAPYTVDWLASEMGNHVISAVATDNEQATGSNALSVTIIDGSLPNSIFTGNFESESQ